MTDLKTCSRCGVAKPFQAFNRKKDGAHGLRTDCRECSRSAQAAAYAANPSKWREAAARVRAEQPERVRVWNQQWRAKNPEKVAASVAKWNARNPGALRAAERAWAKRNPEAIATKSRARRARARAAGGSHTTQQIEELFTLQRGRCACCGAELDRYHVDHIEALANGGRNDILNLQLLCPPCNTAKAARDPIEFMQSRGKLL